MRPVNDDNELMREIVRDAFWSIAFHEQQLANAHEHLATVRSLMMRCEFVFTDAQATEIYHDHDDDGPEDCRTPHDLVAYFLGSALWGVEHHEAELRKAHGQLGAAKALMARAGIAVPIEEVEREVSESLANRR